ncbi:MAG: MFS transporter [Bacillota bacterium]
MDKVVKEKFKTTKIEKSWILYDVANSAYVLMATALIPIFYGIIATNAGMSDTAQVTIFGTMLSLAALVVGLLNPILGAIADNKGMRKKMFLFFLLVGVVGCFLFSIANTVVIVAIVMIISQIGLNGSIVFSDAMLVDITVENRMDRVSSRGYAWGYIGSCIPFIICLVIYMLTIMPIGGEYLLPFSETRAIQIGMVITGFWWIIVTLPLLKNYKQKYGVEPSKNQIKDSFAKLAYTFKNAKNYKVPFMFVIAFFFYINGVTTIIGMSITYASSVLGANAIDSIKLVLALLMTQFVAFPSAIVMGNLANKVSPRKLILISIAGYFCVTIFAVFLSSITQFFIMAFFVGLFQGGIQALSRSYFAKIVPKEKSNEFFGMYDICSKGAAVLGPAVMAAATLVFNSPRVGVGILVWFFLIGGIILMKLPENISDLPIEEYDKLYVNNQEN